LFHYFRCLHTFFPSGPHFFGGFQTTEALVDEVERAKVEAEVAARREALQEALRRLGRAENVRTIAATLLEEVHTLQKVLLP
jgi:hypothetical protein